MSATNDKGQHPLHVAVAHGHIAVAEALLKAGADPNVHDDDTDSPLYLARRNLAMTRVLLQHGADVKAVDMTGYTMLHRAGEDGHADVVEALVEAGANIEAESGLVTYDELGDFEALTPLHAAALQYNLDVMSALLRQGADANVIDSNGQTPLHMLCKTSAHALVGQGLIDGAADLLLRWGADETLTDNGGRTPEQLIERVEVNESLRGLLQDAPADRAWRRRGMLVMCRAFADKMPTAAGKAKARRGRGRGHGGGSAGGGHGRGNVLTRVMELDDDAIFRTIVGFL